MPPPLAAAFLMGTVGGAKRERTQAQLLYAAVQVFAGGGVGSATMQQIAQAAGVTTATLYNHFSTKEELVVRLAAAIAGTLCKAIDDSYGHIADGAERMAIGQRRYVWLAAESPGWALMLLEVIAAAPEVLAQVQAYPLKDLRVGVRQKKFKVPSEAAALDAINGICIQAMRRVATGRAPAHHDVAAAAMVLRALGVPPDQAAEIAKRPLPPLPEPQPPEAARPRATKVAQRRA
ncbi:TetR/AcrR family transcriptional regulator [Ramlibacter sp.]|uniref:TetR/AcrR family transcriptional regulator n=1 Tax=Ramlibacter sp. TaxID=1917967 RepID=UPI002D7259BC|nr:TetR family transcriptional regulator [Ramlibacter sp.]HYD77508.1 TetR family transcriptional regulator [Ramlibacter sp.]